MKKNIRFSQEGAKMIEDGAARLDLSFAELIERAVAAYLDAPNPPPPAPPNAADPPRP